ncbi:hypothetical protein PPSIR1_26918 [Plesiocystis pacifica SIR-1]|uniref:Uncharacterized protein n=1 Tax=Plesiocystis pacifica SIR-1 TaxID=391625 RepID=A6GD87_9BACT|nr:hypothetical protein [Plesiocystis pacifica]EDM76162.1 hypothetical protein PPSIR1_26918 [Plesiocystis pacifica SIR-1]
MHTKVSISLALASLCLGCRAEATTSPTPAEHGPPAVAPIEVSAAELAEAKPERSSSELTLEDLAEARRMAGHASMEEIAAENARMFERGAREYIKTRMPEYRRLLADLRALVTEVEQAAPSWRARQELTRFEQAYGAKVDAFIADYERLTARGVEGGETQAKLGAVVREWEELNGALEPGIAAEPEFAEAIQGIRDGLDAVELALDGIDGDGSLVVDPDYVPPPSP